MTNNIFFKLRRSFFGAWGDCLKPNFVLAGVIITVSMQIFTPAFASNIPSGLKLVSGTHARGELITTFQEGLLRTSYTASSRQVSAYGMGQADIDAPTMASSTLGCYMQGAGFCVARVVPDNVLVGIRDQNVGEDNNPSSWASSCRATYPTGCIGPTGRAGPLVALAAAGSWKIVYTGVAIRPGVLITGPKSVSVITTNAYRVPMVGEDDYPIPPKSIASCSLSNGSTSGDARLGNITYTGKNFDKASSQFIPGVTVIATCTGDVNNGSLQTNVGVTFSSRGVTGTSIPIPSHTAFSLVGLKGAGQDGTTLPSADTFCSSSNNSLRVIFGSRMPLGTPIPADSYSSMSRRWTYWFGLCSKQGAASNEIGSGPINIPVTYDVVAYS